MNMGEITARLWNKAGCMRIPLAGAFELLPICNLHCKMCYVRKSEREVREAGGLLDTAQWLSYAEQARDAGMLFPLLTGGEPFLRKDFREIFGEMRKMGLQISINSNGTLIDRDMAEWLGFHKPTRINITLYGASEESYERLCGSGDAFLRVRQGVEWLKQYGVPVKFNTSITPENVEDIEAMMEYAKSVGSPLQAATYMFPPVRRDQTMIGKNHRLTPDMAAYARVKADWLQGDTDWFLGQAARFARFVPLDRLPPDDGAEVPPAQMHCRAGRSSFWIDWQGNLANCGMYSQCRVPLKGKTFSEAWDEIVRATDAIQYRPACLRCPNQILCHACIAMVYNECGATSGRPEYLCRMNEKSAEYYREFAQNYLNCDPSERSVPEEREENCIIDEQ
ncbi:MAG: radical SAM protein [Eubacteriales bacterium]